MKRPLFLICCLFFLAASFAQKGDQLLLSAYKKNSLRDLESFFDTWALETPPISNEDFLKLNDTIKNIYLVFKAFYTPNDLERTGGSEWGNNIYLDAKYFLIQDKIFFAVVDTSINEIYASRREIFPANDKYDSLENFRPQLSFPNVKCITLTNHYEELLNRFLGNTYYPLGTGNIMNPARSKGESQKRMQFLENYVKIWYGHWGGYWQLHTYPYATRITFDKNFQNAVIDYQVIYEGGYAYLKKINNEWTLIKAERTWIE